VRPSRTEVAWDPPVPHAFGGRPVFLDGSGLHQSLGGLAAAGWSIVEVDEQGRQTHAAYGPVPLDWPQTSGAGELFAYFMLLELAVNAPPAIYSDYQALVNGTAACSLDAIPESSQLLRLWARILFKLADHGTAVTHATREDPLRSHVWAASKVKGHATRAEAGDLLAAWLKLGNDLADDFAKRGARLQGISEVAVQEASFGMREARLVATAAGIVLAAPGVDPTPTDLARRDPQRRARRRRRTAANGNHYWLSSDLGWVCRWCAARPRSERGLAAAARRPCAGEPLQDLPAAVLRGGHCLWLSWRDLKAPYLWCSTCGSSCEAGARTWARDLRKPCPGTPSSGWGRWAIKSFRALRHPVTKEVLERSTRLSAAVADQLLRRAQAEAGGSADPQATADALGEGRRPGVDLTGATFLPPRSPGLPLGCFTARGRAEVVDLSSGESEADLAGERPLVDVDSDDDFGLVLAAAVAAPAPPAAPPGSLLAAAGPAEPRARRPGIPRRVREAWARRKAEEDAYLRYADSFATDWRPRL
jgi:hypothetical protein